jgi:hypothetical protein
MLSAAQKLGMPMVKRLYDAHGGLILDLGMFHVPSGILRKVSVFCMMRVVDKMEYNR